MEEYTWDDIVAALIGDEEWDYPKDKREAVLKGLINGLL